MSGAGKEHRRRHHPAERRQRILRFLEERGSSSVAAVVELFGVSPTTARRDLGMLAAQGRAQRTHGGAVLRDLATRRESFDMRLGTDADEKIRLARALVAEVAPHETLFVDSTSTAYFVLQEILRGGLAVTVATNSLAAIAAVADANSANVDVIALGGIYRRDNRSFVGVETLRAIRNLVVDRFVLSVKGIEDTGRLTDPHPMEAEVKRAMVESARSVVLVAGARKFAAHGLYLVGHAHEVDVAYLSDPPFEAVEALKHRGVQVRVV